MSIRSYPKVYNLGHRAVVDILHHPVVVQEKIDGSQISFMIDHSGALHIRSKGADIDVDNPPKMFQKAIEEIVSRQALGKLLVGLIYRGEYLSGPKHNVLQYERVPNGNIILFDIESATTDQQFSTMPLLTILAKRADFETVPVIYEGDGKDLSLDKLKQLLDLPSVLGGRIEGVVMKAYGIYGIDGKTLMGKFVSEEFKEVHGKEWRKANPTNGDVIEQIVKRLSCVARWEKAVQHLREQGKLENDPKDIGELIKEVQFDVAQEEGEAIRAMLFQHAWKKIGRDIVRGLPQWYKERLLAKQFGEDGDEQRV